MFNSKGTMPTDVCTKVGTYVRMYVRTCDCCNLFELVDLIFFSHVHSDYCKDPHLHCPQSLALRLCKWLSPLGNKEFRCMCIYRRYVRT